MNQNAISRLESPDYGKPTITTLKRLASALDVALVVRLVPFSELAHWVGGKVYLNKGISTESLAVPEFSGEERDHVLDLALAMARRREVGRGITTAPTFALAGAISNTNGQDMHAAATAGSGQANVVAIAPYILPEKKRPETATRIVGTAAPSEAQRYTAGI